MRNSVLVIKAAEESRKCCWNWGKTVASVVHHGHLIPMLYTRALCCDVTWRLGAYARDPALVGLEDSQTPVQNCCFSGALPWSHAQNPAHRTPFFSFSGAIFPSPSVDLKGTTSSRLYPCCTYPSNIKELGFHKKNRKILLFHVASAFHSATIILWVEGALPWAPLEIGNGKRGERGRGKHS